MKLAIFLSPEAEADIIAIYMKGISEFGPSQADRYELVLRGAIEKDLAEYPELGPARPELGKGIRSLYRGAHHIYYLVESERLVVVRILSERMNVDDDALQSALEHVSNPGKQLTR